MKSEKIEHPAIPSPNKLLTSVPQPSNVVEEMIKETNKITMEKKYMLFPRGRKQQNIKEFIKDYVDIVISKLIVQSKDNNSEQAEYQHQIINHMNIIKKKAATVKWQQAPAYITLLDPTKIRKIDTTKTMLRATAPKSTVYKESEILENQEPLGRAQDRLKYQCMINVTKLLWQLLLKLEESPMILLINLKNDKLNIHQWLKALMMTAEVNKLERTITKKQSSEVTHTVQLVKERLRENEEITERMIENLRKSKVILLLHGAILK